jgi:hypothetical protein
MLLKSINIFPGVLTHQVFFWLKITRQGANHGDLSHRRFKLF